LENFITKDYKYVVNEEPQHLFNVKFGKLACHSEILFCMDLVQKQSIKTNHILNTPNGSSNHNKRKIKAQSLIKKKRQ
jgi:hypothetical protein